MPAAKSGKPRLLFIVSRDQPMLQDYVRRGFGDASDVLVIVDRRVGERRRQNGPVPREQRRADRRRPQADERLRSLGWTVVHLD